MPPLVVDDDEAMALAVAIQSYVASGDEAALRALTKVVQVLPRRLRVRLNALGLSTTPAPWSPGLAIDHAVLSTLALGCRDSERIRPARIGRLLRALVTVPLVTNTGPKARSFSIRGKAARLSPTLAPCTQTRRPAGRGMEAMPNR